MTQLASALGREPIELCLAIVFGKSPFGVKQSLVLQSPKGRIKRAFFEQQGIVTLTAEQAGYGITVKRSPDQGFEDENIKRAAKNSSLAVSIRTPSNQREDSHISRLKIKGCAEACGSLWPHILGLS